MLTGACRLRFLNLSGERSWRKRREVLLSRSLPWLNRIDKPSQTFRWCNPDLRSMLMPTQRICEFYSGRFRSCCHAHDYAVSGPPTTHSSNTHPLCLRSQRPKNRRFLRAEPQRGLARVALAVAIPHGEPTEHVLVLCLGAEECDERYDYPKICLRGVIKRLYDELINATSTNSLRYKHLGDRG